MATDAHHNTDRHDTGTRDLDYTMMVLDEYRASLTVQAACELELFDLVAKGDGDSDTVKSIATAQGWDEESLERLMDALVALKMLHKMSSASGDRYSCTPSGGYLRRHTVESVWSYSSMAKHMMSSMMNMAKEIKSGQHRKTAFPAHVTVHKSASNDPLDYVEEEDHHHKKDHTGKHHKGSHSSHSSHSNHGGHSNHHGNHCHSRYQPVQEEENQKLEGEADAHHLMQVHGHNSHHRGHHHGHHHGHSGTGLIDAESLYERYKSFDTVGQLQAPHLITAYDLSPFKTAVDLGAGTGCMGYALARKHSDMHVTLMDVPRVIELIKKHFLPQDLKQLKTEFLPGDFFITELPEADLYLLSKIVHDWNPEQVKKLLTLCYHKINPGGAIMLFEKCLNDRKDGPISAHMWDTFILSLCAGKLRSGKEYRHLLEEIGFADVQIHRTQELCAFDIIYARKY